MTRALLSIVCWVALCAGPGPEFASARPEPAPEARLSYAEAKALAALAVKDNDLEFVNPSLLVQKDAQGRQTVFIFAGDAEGDSGRDLPVDPQLFKTQLCLELLRARLFANADDRRFMENACDAAEAHLRAFVTLGEAKSDGPDLASRSRAQKAEMRALWKLLFDSFEDWAKRHDGRFGGFLHEAPQKAWTPEPPRPVPFERGYHSGAPVQLIGPAGVEVHFMLNLRRRLYEMKKVAPEAWDWGRPYQLNPQSPPGAFLTIGANYYVLVKRGTSALAPYELRLQPTDAKYTVPLPD